MCDETHCIVGVAVEGQFDYTDYFLFSGVGEVFVLVVVFLVCGVEDKELVDLASVRRAETCFLADFHVVFEHGPEFDLVVLIDS